MRENTLGAAALIEIVVDERDVQMLGYCVWVTPSRGNTSAIVGLPR